MGRINLHRVRSVCCLSWFSLFFVILAIAGILYLYFTNINVNGQNIDYLRYSNWLLGFLILNSKDSNVVLQLFCDQTTVFVNFCIMIVVYILAYFGIVFFPTISSLIAIKVTDIKGFGRTAIFTTPAVIIWLVLAPLVWLVSIIILLTVATTYINKEKEMIKKYGNNYLSSSNRSSSYKESNIAA